MKKKKKNKIITYLTILICISLFITFLYLILFKNKDEEDNDIVLVPYNDYDFSKLSNHPYLTYEDDRYTSMFGIDVAAHQETIDWKKVKESGVEFAYIRLGYRGASEGKLNVDLEFERNYLEATKNDIKVGVYWYSQPINTEEAIEEAKFVLDVLDGRHLDLPIVYDFEETILPNDKISRIHDMNKQERTEVAEAFCEYMISAKQDVMLYTYLDWSENYYEEYLLEKYPIWFAQYEEYPQFEKPFVMWQYCDEGQIDGIEHKCDLDIMFILKEQ